MIAGGAASVSFQPKALDIVHRRSAGIPRLVNLLCDRALLAAYSARTNRVSSDMVQTAAENLELGDAQPSRFGWFRRRASMVVMTAGATASLGVAAGLVAPVIRASQVSQANATPPQPISLSDAPARQYAVLAASFPLIDLSDSGSDASVRLSSIVSSLEAMGYDVRLMDVDRKARGMWRRVLVGDHATLEGARAEAERLHQAPEFAGVQPIQY
jgi:hypothetical protein